MTGTVFRRKDASGSNRWQMVVRFHKSGDPEEYRRTKVITAGSKGEAQKQLREWMEILGQYNWESDKLMFESFCPTWLRRHAKSKNLSLRTVDSYQRLIDRYLIPAFGRYTMTEITTEKVADFFDRILSEKIDIKQRKKPDKSMNYRTARMIFYLLNQILRSAYQWEKIPINPMDRLDPPSGKPSSPKVFSECVVRQIFDALENEGTDFQLMVVLGITTGCREGELLGLSWNDYDTVQHTFFIHQTVQYTVAKGTYVYPHTKTENSRRKCYVIPQLWKTIEAKKAESEKIRSCAAKTWNSYNLVFYNVEGMPVRPNTLSNHFGKFIRKH